MVLEDGQPAALQPKCAAGLAGYQGYFQTRLTQKNGLKLLDSRLHQARRILAESGSSIGLPLVLIADDISLADQLAAVRLAKKINACTDTSAGLHAGWLPGVIATLGLHTCTLGDLRQRTDCVLLWDVDPQTSHPRFNSRFLPTDPSTRLILSNTPCPPGRKRAALTLPSNADPFETLALLSLGLDDASRAPRAFVPILSALHQSRFGVLVFGESVSRLGSPLLSALLQLTKRLREKQAARWSVIYLAPDGGSLFSGDVLASNCGYPAAVRFSPAGMEYSPPDFAASALLERHETSLVICAGSPGWLPVITRKHLAKTACIQVGGLARSIPNSLHLPAALPGVDGSGVRLRLDGVPIPVQPIHASGLPSIAELLDNLVEGILP